MSLFDIEPTSNEEDIKDKENELKQEETTKSTPMVTIDGPLSKVYSEALGMVLAIETIMATSTGIVGDYQGNVVSNKFNSDNSISDGNIEPVEEDKGVYVYCCDSKDLEGTNLLKVMNDIKVSVESNRYKSTVVSIEHANGGITNKISLLSDYCKDVGVNVTTNRAIAIDMVDSLVSNNKDKS